MNRLILIGATAFVFLSRTPVSAADTLWTAIPGSVDPKTTQLTDMGPADPASMIEFDVGLVSKDPQGETQFLQDLYDPSSPSFHKFLTPEEFCQRFGPDPDLFGAAQAYFFAQGITVYPQVGCILMHCGGSVGRIESALNTTIELYDFSGAPTFANSVPLMVPSSIYGVISNISGLDALVPHPTPGWQ